MSKKVRYIALLISIAGALLIGLLARLNWVDNSVEPQQPLVPISVIDSSATSLPPRVQAAGRLILAADAESIVPILDANPLLMSADDGNKEWLPDTMVIGVHINGEATAYPIGFLSLHEVINDTVGSEPVVVTWCPLCFSAVIYSRKVEDETRTFRVSGYLFESNLVLEDLQTRTLWSQLSGLSVRGGTGRQRLSALPFQFITWAEWQALYPQTKIISGKLSENPTGFDYYNDPYANYYGGGVTGLGRTTSTDERLPAKTIVIGLDFDSEVVAVPYNAIYAQGFLQLNIGTQPIIIFMNSTTATTALFSAEYDGDILQFYQAEDGTFRDEKTNSIWHPQTGIAESGGFAGEALTQLPFRSGFWFAWADHYPNTQVWGVDYP